MTNEVLQKTASDEQNVSSSNGLEPKIRFPEFNENYKTINLSEYLFENKDRNKSEIYSKQDVLSVSGEFGIVNQIKLQGRSFAGESVKEYHIVETNDIVYTKSPLKANPYGIIKVNKGIPGIVSTLYAVYHVKNTAFPEYIDYYFSNNLRLNKYLKPLVNIGAKHDMKVNNETVLIGCVTFPKVEEQQKIANFLYLIDQRIEKQRQLVESLKKYKRGLFFEIFEQKRRFKDGNNKFYPKWEKKSLGTIFKERTERAIGNEELLSVTINSGVKKRCEVDVKDNSSDDKSKYKKLYPNDIAYNTMRMWQGASGVSLYEGIVSPAYTVITPIIPVKIGFFGYYFKYIKTIQIFQKFSQGLTSDTWNLKYPQLSEIQLLIPNIEEQEKIYETFKFLDDKILLSENTLNLLQDIKKGLLQKMFI